MAEQHDCGGPTGSARATRRGRRALRASALAGASALTVVLVAACSSGGDGGSGGGGGGGGAVKNDPAAAEPASVLKPSVPDRIVIPDIKVDAGLDSVGLDAQGAMQEPDFAKPKDAAWYKDGPTPGEKGAAAIVGHMDTPQVPEAVFYNLKELKKGEKIEVHRDDGSTAVFAVDEVGTFKKDRFPTEKVYGDTHGKAELRVITCGGNLTKDRHWDANVVVFAHLVGQD